LMVDGSRQTAAF